MNLLTATGTLAIWDCFAVCKDIQAIGERKKIVPKDSLSKHILLRGFGSQGNKQQRRCSLEIHSDNRGLTGSTQPGTLSVKLQPSLLL